MQGFINQFFGDLKDMEQETSKRMNYPAASCEVSTPRLRTAMARQFGGVELVSLVSVFPRTLEQPQLDVLAMQLRIAFVTALLSYICCKSRSKLRGI